MVTNIGELWDQDDTFEELHLSGSLEELPEATGEKAAENHRNHEWSKVFSVYDTSDLPHEEVTEALPVSQKNIWCNAYMSEKVTASSDQLLR